MKYIAITIGIAVLTSLATLPSPNNALAAEDQRYLCDMTGTWITGSGSKDDFLFYADYIAKGGPDYNGPTEIAVSQDNARNSSPDIKKRTNVR